MREMTGDTTKTAVVQETSRLYNKPRQAPDTGSGQGYGPGASFIPSSDLDNIDLRQERGNPVCLAAHRSEDAPVRHGPDHLLAVLKPSVEIVDETAMHDVDSSVILDLTILEMSLNWPLATRLMLMSRKETRREEKMFK